MHQNRAMLNEHMDIFGSVGDQSLAPPITLSHAVHDYITINGYNTINGYITINVYNYSF